MELENLPLLAGHDNLNCVTALSVQHRAWKQISTDVACRNNPTAQDERDGYKQLRMYVGYVSVCNIVEQTSAAVWAAEQMTWKRLSSKL